jgi:sugar phosphate isomerase/epimerase
MKIAAFPKCYLDEIAGARTMSVFDWIAMARQLDAEGLEMYDGFFTSLADDYIDQVGEAIASAGFAMPMLCCSPDFTNPNLDGRKRAVEREATLIRVTRRLGGSRAACRVLSGQRYPHVGVEQGLAWVVESIEQLLPVAREYDIVLALRICSRSTMPFSRRFSSIMTSASRCYLRLTASITAAKSASSSPILRASRYTSRATASVGIGASSSSAACKA